MQAENTHAASLEQRVWLPIVILLSIALRVFVPLCVSFPVNDGGLFYRMALDLEANGLKLPMYTSYNLSQIPFSYPPLGIYLVAILHKFCGIGLFDSLRLLPPLICCLALWPAWLIFRELIPSASGRIVALAFLGLKFASYEWLIMGGGITRSPGLLFGLYALAYFLVARRTESFKLLLFSATMAGLAVLSHPLMSAVMVLSIACFGLFSAWSFGVKQSVAAILLFLGIWLPWFFAVVGMHGLVPFLQAVGTGQMTVESLLRPFWLFANGSVIYEAPTVILLFLGLLGCVLEKNFRILIWFFVLFEIPRLSFLHSALPVAILCGFGFELLASLPIFKSRHTHNVGGRLDALNVVFAIAIGIVAGLSALKTANLESETLREADLQMLTAIREVTPAHSKFFIVTKRGDQRDALTEWFPALTERYSLRTFEGKEWLNREELNGIYVVRQQLGQVLSECSVGLPKLLADDIGKANFMLFERPLDSTRFTAGFSRYREFDRYSLYRRSGEN